MNERFPSSGRETGPASLEEAERFLDLMEEKGMTKPHLGFALWAAGLHDAVQKYLRFDTDAFFRDPSFSKEDRMKVWSLVEGFDAKRDADNILVPMEEMSA